MTLTTTTLDRLTRNVSAFRTWEEFRAALAAGYVPTMRPQAGRSRSQQAWNQDLMDLRQAVLDAGFQVYPQQLP